MSNKVYKARQGAHLTHEQAQTIGEHLEVLGPEITAPIVVQDARNPSSPLHQFFEWDDTVAAEKWRLQQARVLITKIEIVMEGEQTMPAYYHLEITKDKQSTSAYFDLATVQSNPDLRSQILENAWKELESWRDRYSRYKKHLGPAFKLVDKALTINGRSKKTA